MNILILSAGTRNKIIQYFKKELLGIGRVIAADCSPYSPALYDADKHYIVPRITSEDYLDIIYDICNKEQINGVLSLIDPELSLLAEHTRDFSDKGVKVIGSPLELCERSLDKYEMYKWLSSHGYHNARSYIDKEAFFSDIAAGVITYPVFIKPITGSASKLISIAHDEKAVEYLFDSSSDLLIQEYLNGQEIGVDAYIDMLSGEVVSIFAKKKMLMRAGETDKAVSFKDANLFRLVERFCRESGYLGPIDMDIFRVGNDYYISEINPRFGGGYPHAYECGCNHVKMILNNLSNIENSNVVGEYDDDVYMMKYNEIKIIRR